MIIVSPIQDRHLVRREEAKEKTKGGLIIPEVGKEVPARGTVIASGHGKRYPDGTFAPNVVLPGDKILFGRYAGSGIEVNGETLLLIREDEILGTYSERYVITERRLTGSGEDVQFQENVEREVTKEEFEAHEARMNAPEPTE